MTFILYSDFSNLYTVIWVYTFINFEKKVPTCMFILLTCHFSLNQTSSFYEEFLFSIFFGLYITTTFPCNLHKMIDPIDPRSHPQGVPQFQAQYIKLNTPCTIAILIIFIYMVANEIL